MKFIFKTILLISVFFISLLIFLPKESLYNLLEKELYKHNIIISEEVRNEELFSLNINSSEVYYDGINTALIQNANISTYLIFSKVNIEKIRVSNSLKNFLPSKIERLELSHSIINFNSIKINSIGDFGEFKGSYSLFDKKVLGELIPSTLMKTKYRNILNQFKLKDGKYYYEYKL
ncbi:hypothetical protein [Arcobacter sp. LA11]|uniref:hypothetical protein n=1 Tax=Arcobacter sp. LA11 TaxID=1898176 RepID=UPI000934F61A|nr:hypothetical protein [Arcobacter sp. LA11]